MIKLYIAQWGLYCDSSLFTCDNSRVILCWLKEVCSLRAKRSHVNYKLQVDFSTLLLSYIPDSMISICNNQTTLSLIFRWYRWKFPGEKVRLTGAWNTQVSRFLSGLVKSQHQILVAIAINVKFWVYGGLWHFHSTPPPPNTLLHDHKFLAISGKSKRSGTLIDIMT